MALRKLIYTLFLCFTLHKSIVSGDENDTSRKFKVCVIGAGGAGISMTRHLVDHLDKFDVTVYEKTSNVGGTWVYTDKTGEDEYGYPIHSSMYKYLRTNVPKEIMNFPDWPKIDYEKSCLPHSIVEAYLNNYTDHYNLRPFIKFNAIVLNVTLEKSQPSDKWRVLVKHLKTSKLEEQVFDHVIVCNGHYSTPYIPKIPGIENFTGRKLHSHEYREPEQFINKTVIVLGAGSSGIDIGHELVNFTTKVYLSHNHDKIQGNLGFVQVSGIDRFENGQFVLKDKNTINGDVLLYTTGYVYEYPFLSESTGIKVQDNYFVKPLYKHIVNVDHPSMTFVGVSTGIIPFPMFHAQSQFIISYLEGKTKLPSSDEIRLDPELKFTRIKSAHVLKNSWTYIDQLANIAHFTTVPKYYSIAFDVWMSHWHSHYENFKDYNLVIGDDQKSATVVKPGEPEKQLNFSRSENFKSLL